MPVGAGVEAPGGIRKKSAFSCDGCRRRKVKCDGGRPVCARCAARHEECVYKLSPSISYTQKLENRVQALEQALQKAGVEAGRPLSDPGSQEDSLTPFQGLEKGEDGRVSFHGSTSLTKLTTSTSAAERAQNSLLDGLGEQDKNQLISNALAERAFEEISSLPELMQALLDSHWCWVQPLFNFIYRPVFTRDLHTNGPYCPYILINAVLAHSVRWAKADSHIAMLLEPYDNGAYFSQQVKDNLMGEIQKGPAQIPMVQTLLILSAQESGKGNLTQAWLYSGMAFRLLEDLGVIVDGRKVKGAVNFSAEELEIRNRLFWSCYLWDKLLSLYLGRLPVLQETKMSPPRNIMDDTGELDIWRPQGIPPHLAAVYPPMQAHTTSCFVHICSLAEILDVVLVTMYNPVEQSSHAEVLACAASQGRKLTDWYDDLPSHLKIRVSEMPQHCPPSHIVTLNCLYHSIRILLHRPILTSFNRNVDMEGSEKATHLRQCLESATAVLSIYDLFVRSFGDGHVVLSQAYTIYTAASIFLLQVQATKDLHSSAMDHLKFCIDALERIKHTSPVIRAPLALIYKQLETLDPTFASLQRKTVAHMPVPNAFHETQAGDDYPYVSYASSWLDSHDLHFGDMDLSNAQLDPEIFSSLPNLEPVSANVNADIWHQGV
ncbi:hypothetical protein KC331_g17182 [Hortaea werneckii]|nr:hypothetical protein KC331_g17182 [Hortaea werneckii]KAI7718425.1 hypothetical protein KC353_g3794 [Hortaea werneckii]